MALKIEWTDEADAQLDDIIEHLETNWTEREIEHFFEELERGLKHISNNPLQYKQSLRKVNTREYQITKHTTLFYQFDDTKATVMLLWKNAMDPNEL